MLAGLDDGPSDRQESLAMANVAISTGIGVVVVTPHVNGAFRPSAEQIEQAAETLRNDLGDAQLPLNIVTGAEVSLELALRLADTQLSELCLGNSNYILVETPNVHTSLDLRAVLFDLQLRGFKPVFAHPERSPALQHSLNLASELARRGALYSVTAGSFDGRFGKQAQRYARQLLKRGLVHNIASDAHDSTERVPNLAISTNGRNPAPQSTSDEALYFSKAVPEAILAGAPVPKPIQSQRDDHPARKAISALDRTRHKLMGVPPR
jgi:protein-tyrosine phosphatase